MSDKEEWPFDQAPNVAAITTRQVIEDGFPVLLVTHYEDDDSWAFVCGTTNETDDGRIIGMKEALTIDPTLAQISHLDSGYSAYRSGIGQPWSIRKD